MSDFAANTKVSRAALFRAMNVNSLFADPLWNPKVAKNGKLGVLTAPLHLAPARVSGYETCPSRSDGCTKACLNNAGNPAYAKGKRKARVARTIAYFEKRPQFMTALALEIAAHVKRAVRQNMEPAIRPNATSDIPWERIPVTYMGITYRNIMEAFPEVQFYDYTKILKRALSCARRDKSWPRNYHLTFSLTENNDVAAAEVLTARGNVSVVFNVKRKRALPTSYTIAGHTALVIDADEHDFRPVDGTGVICGLRFKLPTTEVKHTEDMFGFVRAAA
jgi:hypothetical protein